MCVILQFDDVMPKSSLLKNAEQTNRDGGGFAYIKDGLVHWEKGLHVTAKYVEKYVKKHKLTKKNNLIVHFRIGTHGENNDMLCHPFPLGLRKNGQAVENSVKGITSEGVMFHNGVWTEYDEYAVKLAFNSDKIRIPDGDMSDSSIMAWCASHKGINFLEFTGEKVIVLTPDGTVRYGDGWTTVDKVKCSNDNFEPDTTWAYSGGYGSMMWSAKDKKMIKDNSEESCDISSDDYEKIIEDEKKMVGQSYMDNSFYGQDELDYYDGKAMRYRRGDVS